MSDRAITFGRVPVIVDNPLLDAARLVDPQIDARGGPGGWRLDWNVHAYAARRKLSQQYAWGIPNQAAIEAIAALGPVVEIGAGTGYWASLLTEFGVDVVAYDAEPGHNHWCKHDCYHPVAVGGPVDVTRHQDRALLLCWPPMSTMARGTLALYSGRYVAYVGELVGGCCADDEFFEMLEREWTEISDVTIPQWPGLHDTLVIHERKR